MPTGTTTRAFRKGLNNVKVKDLRVVKQRILQILGVKSQPMLRLYADGKIATLDVEKARRIETLFAEYGVNDCWGEN